MRRRCPPLWSMAVACVVLIACGSGTGSPLGGPYGGGAYRLGPTDGGFNKFDAAYSPPRSQAGSGANGDPGTWTHIFTAYMAAGTIGNCTPCHKDMSNPSKAYKWLADQGYMGGKDGSLTSRGTSCLTWYGGDMPPGKPPVVPDSVAQEMDLWANMGGRNN